MLFEPIFNNKQKVEDNEYKTLLRSFYRHLDFVKLHIIN